MHDASLTRSAIDARRRPRSGDGALLAAALRPAAPTRWPPSRPTQRALPGLRGAAARRVEPAAVGAGAHRLVPGVLDRAQPAARAGRTRRPRRAAACPRARRRRRAVQLQPGAARHALGSCRCPMPTPRAPNWRRSSHATLALLQRRRRPTTHGALLLPPGAAARGHAPRGRAVHGAGAGHRRSSDPRWQAAPLPAPAAALAFAGGRWRAGQPAGARLRVRQRAAGAHAVALAPTSRSTAGACAGPSSCPSSRHGGYDEPRWWTDAGARWRASRRRARRATCAATAPAGSSGAMAAGSALDPARGRLPPEPARSRGLVPLGRPPAAHRGRVGTRRLQRSRGTSAGATCGSGRPAPSRPTRASSRTPTATIRRPGSTAGRCCAAPRS